MARRYTNVTSDPASFSIAGTSAISAVAWVYNETSTTNGIDGFFCSNASFTNYFWIGAQSNNWHFETEGSVFTTAMSLNTWTHIALTLDGTNARSYLNGALVDTRAFSLTGRPTHTQADMGSFFGDAVQIQDVACFTTTLSATDIAMIYRSRFLRVQRSNLYGWWPLFNDAATVDWSSNGHTLNSSGTGAGTTSPPVAWGAGLRPMTIRSR